MTSAIDGCTRLLGVIADPVSHARSPAAANGILAERGQEAAFVLVPMHVSAEGLPAALAGLRSMQNFAGSLVSMPHKKTVMPMLDGVTERAGFVGAVNVLRRETDGRLIGDILDGEGFARGLEAAGHAVKGATCVLAGAGGAATAIAFSLAQRGCASLTILNRTRASAEALAARVRAAYPAVDVFSTDAGNAIDIAINGTSLGMRSDDELPFAEDVILRSTVVAECVVGPEMTALLELAQRHGRPIHIGLRMLEAQISLLLDFMGAGAAQPPRSIPSLSSTSFS